MIFSQAYTPFQLFLKNYASIIVYFANATTCDMGDDKWMMFCEKRVAKKT